MSAQPTVQSYVAHSSDGTMVTMYRHIYTSLTGCEAWQNCSAVEPSPYLHACVPCSEWPYGWNTWGPCEPINPPVPQSCEGQATYQRRMAVYASSNFQYSGVDCTGTSAGWPFLGCGNPI